VALLDVEIGRVDDKLLRFGVSAELRVRVVLQADPGVARICKYKEGLAAEDDHEGANRELSLIEERGPLDVPLY